MAMSSARQFDRPIILKDGRKISTVAEALAMMMALPFQLRTTSVCQRAADLLQDADRRKGAPSDVTLAQLRKALVHAVLLENKPNRKVARNDRGVGFRVVEW
jgi:hypothetical protein